MSETRERLLDVITQHYLNSRDFNGMPLHKLSTQMGLTWPVIRPHLMDPIREQLIGVLFANSADNTHILRFGCEPVDVQVQKLSITDDLVHTCVYPLGAHLSKVVDPTAYAGQPYRLELALGEPQLSYRSFDLAVLEAYRNDPRYVYQTTDIDGIISVRDEFFESERMMTRDQVLLQSFGFAYDDDLNRAVAVFLRYLAHLSPEHQQIWQARELPGQYKLHPDYFRSSIQGEFPERESIFTALLVELHVINQMAKAIGRPPLFKKDYGPYAEDKPRQLTFLVRPTLDEFNSFVHLLDKLLSDNINKDFFRGDISMEVEKERPDGKIVVSNKGTLTMLDEWVRQKVHLPDWEPWTTAMSALKKVRNLRQKPAHAVEENVFDQKYVKEQRELMIHVYSAVRTLRQLLANHPAAKKVDVPEWLYEGAIWSI